MFTKSFHALQVSSIALCSIKMISQNITKSAIDKTPTQCKTQI